MLRIDSVEIELERDLRCSHVAEKATKASHTTDGEFLPLKRWIEVQRDVLDEPRLGKIRFDFLQRLRLILILGGIPSDGFLLVPRLIGFD